MEHTAGTGNIKTRVNCNEFITNLRENHNFILGNKQNIEEIKKTIPEEFLRDYEEGLKI